MAGAAADATTGTGSREDNEGHPDLPPASVTPNYAGFNPESVIKLSQDETFLEVAGESYP